MNLVQLCCSVPVFCVRINLVAAEGTGESGAGSTLRSGVCVLDRIFLSEKWGARRITRNPHRGMPLRLSVREMTVTPNETGGVLSGRMGEVFLVRSISFVNLKIP